VKTTPEMLLRRKLWAADGAVAWRDYLAAPAIVADKTTRLRQARLERDAAVKVSHDKLVIQTILENAHKKRTTSPKRRRPKPAR
jgi:hypothetical protein